MVSPRLLTSLAAVSYAWARNITSPFGPVVDLGYASFIGNDSSPGVNFFGGIPFAQPPVGNLRWRAPAMLDESPFSGSASDLPTFDSRNFGTVCIQQPASVGIGSEDCLTLNVWQPKGAKAGDNLPVFVWIHGGGFFAGSAQAFNMADWVRITDGNLVAVSIQYRLNLFGGLASQALFADGDANVGLRDQRAALEWIQRHISAFGGNPHRVTIGGQSAGSGAVLDHLVWQGGKPDSVPFSAAVLESVGNDPFILPDEQEQCFNNVTTFVGCDTAADVMSCLRSTSYRTLIAAINNQPAKNCNFPPIVDGTIITDVPSHLVAEGKFVKVPILAGHATDDGTSFIPGPTDVVNDSTLFAGIDPSRVPLLTEESFQQALSLYPQSDFSSFYELAQMLAGNTEFTCIDWFLANKSAEAGQPAFLYRWDTPNPTALASAPFRGVTHGSELYFLFDATGASGAGVFETQTPDQYLALNASEKPLSIESQSYWTSFARSYSPSTFKQDSAINWPVFNSSGGNGQRIVPKEGGPDETATTLEDIPGDYVARCLFWMNLWNETRT